MLHVKRSTSWLSRLQECRLLLLVLVITSLLPAPCGRIERMEQGEPSMGPIVHGEGSAEYRVYRIHDLLLSCVQRLV